MVNVCSEEVWKMFLQRNFEVLTKEIKHIFIYIDPTGKKHNNYCDFIFCEKFFSQEVQKIYLYSIIMHFCFCERSCNVQNNKNCFLCSKLSTKSSDDKVLFKDILLDWRDVSENFLKFSRGNYLMSLSIFWNWSRWLTKFKKHKCEEFYRIKVPFKLFKSF